MLRAVHLGTCVVNVIALTRSVGVIFVPKVPANKLNSRILPVPTPLSSPTAVNVERLVFLLSCYNPVTFLSVGFAKCFPIHYNGM